jgi:hypothetical protein
LVALLISDLEKVGSLADYVKKDPGKTTLMERPALIVWIWPFENHNLTSAKKRKKTPQRLKFPSITADFCIPCEE